jgi:hypothetical protein
MSETSVQDKEKESNLNNIKKNDDLINRIVGDLSNLTQIVSTLSNSISDISKKQKKGLNLVENNIFTLESEDYDPDNLSSDQDVGPMPEVVPDSLIAKGDKSGIIIAIMIFLTTVGTEALTVYMMVLQAFKEFSWNLFCIFLIPTLVSSIYVLSNQLTGYNNRKFNLQNIKTVTSLKIAMGNRDNMYRKMINRLKNEKLELTRNFADSNARLKEMESLFNHINISDQLKKISQQMIGSVKEKI